MSNFLQKVGHVILSIGHTIKIAVGGVEHELVTIKMEIAASPALKDDIHNLLEPFKDALMATLHTAVEELSQKGIADIPAELAKTFDTIVGNVKTQFKNDVHSPTALSALETLVTDSAKAAFGIK